MIAGFGKIKVKDAFSPRTPIAAWWLGFCDANPIRDARIEWWRGYPGLVEMPKTTTFDMSKSKCSAILAKFFTGPYQ